VGIGDEHPEMFGDPLWQKLHLGIARLTVPYDAVIRPDYLHQASEWIRAAEAQHVQILVAFYHSGYTPRKLPTVAVYRSDVHKFVGLFPNVRQYQAYDEANRGNVAGQFSSPSATLAAQYYQALLGVCRGCTVIGLDVLDGQILKPTLQYISAFKREVSHLHTVMPKIWGLHNYSDVNRLEGWRSRDLVRALGGQVWLTETGGIVKFGGSFPNIRGSGLRRAARVLTYTFALARSIPQIKRLYLYNWTGGNARTTFDAGLTDAKNRPRPGYVTVCRAFHAASCAVSVSTH
jgi:hypothetical protein